MKKTLVALAAMSAVAGTAVAADGKCAKFCVCQVLEGGGRNLSPLFYDVG